MFTARFPLELEIQLAQPEQTAPPKKDLVAAMHRLHAYQREHYPETKEETWEEIKNWGRKY